MRDAGLVDVAERGVVVECDIDDIQGLEPAVHRPTTGGEDAAQ